MENEAEAHPLDSEPAMMATPDWNTLDVRVLKVWRIEALLNSLFLSLFLLVGDVIVSTQWKPWPLPTLVSGGILSLGLVLWFQSMVKRRFAYWAYMVTATDLRVRHGIWWRTHQYIPKARIQHIDVTSGPIGRRFGLVQVSVHAAGSVGAATTIPGMTPEVADWLRVELLPEGPKDE